MEKTTVQKIKKAASITANVLIWVFVVFSLLVTILVFTAQGDEDGVPALFGKSFVTIESDSMNPTFKKGDLVFMDKLSDEEKANLKKDDIITYFAPIDINNDGKSGDINTHRIVKVDKDALTVKTKGDNPLTNVAEDNYTLHYSDIIGICKESGRIGGVGAIIGFLRSSLGFFLCIVLPLILFFLYELYKFIMLVVSERAKRAPVSAELEEEIKKRAIEEYLKNQKSAAESGSTDAAKQTAEPAEKSEEPTEAQTPAEGAEEPAEKAVQEASENPEGTDGDN